MSPSNSAPARPPLLNQEDFVRLVHNGLVFYLSRKEARPPLLPPPADCLDLPLADLFPAGDLADFQSLTRGFFGLDNGPDRAAAPETLGAYAARLALAWAAGPGEIVFRTSGSTGEPKASRHSRAMLAQEAAETAGLFPNIKRVLVTVPLMHSYGFIFGVMLPGLLNIPALDLPPLPTVVMDRLRPGDLLVSFPLLLGRLAGAAPAQTRVLSATAPLPEKLFDDLRAMGFGHITEIYGASETGAMAVRSEAGTFELLSHWQRLDDETLARRQPGRPALPCPLPDHVQWLAERRFKPVGRRDLAVQVGGVNVYPGRVAGLIKEHPLVRDCVVRLMRPEEGARLKAFVVSVADADEKELRRALQQLVRARLSPPERPGRFTFGPEPPLSPAGKISDW